ncbi:MAG TPA: GtrA family protein [Acidimicrobiales bacterium]|jgi:putative flippase GtrA
MAFVKDRIFARAGRHLAQLLRYSAVSAISTSVSLTILGILVGTRSVTAGWANVIATAVATVPSFELNRRWVWARKGPRSIHKEAVPYFALTFTGLGFSTLLVSLAAGAASAHHASNAVRTVAAMGGNVVGFGTVWVAQYVILDKILFRHRPHVSGEAAAVPGRQPEPELVDARTA